MVKTEFALWNLGGHLVEGPHRPITELDWPVWAPAWTLEVTFV